MSRSQDASAQSSRGESVEVAQKDGESASGEALPGLPDSWAWARFGEVASIDSKLVSPADYPDYPHIAPDNIEKATGRLLEYKTIAEDGVTSNKNRFFPGQIVYSKIRPYLSKLVVAKFEGLCSADMYPISTSLELKYLFRYMLSEFFLAAVQDEAGNRVVLPKVNKKQRNDVPVPVAPPAEQSRIVSAIESLQARSSRARVLLSEVGPLIGQLRQSVLRDAFSGKLTADWRARHRMADEAARRMDIPVRPSAVNKSRMDIPVRPNSVDSSHANTSDRNVQPTQETASELLLRIRTERRERWQSEQLAKYEAKGKQPPKNWQDKYKEPEPVDESELPELPDGWCWATFDTFIEFVTSCSRGWAKFYSETGPLFVRAQNINTDELVLEDVARVSPPEGSEGTRTRIQANDLLITITGANVAKAAWVNIDIDEAYVSQHVALARLVDPELAPYLHLWTVSEDNGRAQLLEEAYGNGKQG